MKKVPNVNTHIFKQPGLPWQTTTFSDDALAAFEKYDTLGDGLTDAEKTAMAAYIDAETTAGNQAKKDYETIFSLSGNNALVDYIGGKVATAVNAPTHSVNGFTFDGATNYLNSNFNPTSHGVNYKQDDAYVALYIQNFGTANTVSAMYGSAETGLPTLQLIDNVDVTKFRFNSLNSTGSDDWVMATKAAGLYVSHRDNSSEVKFFKNINTDAVTILRTSTGLPNQSIFIGSRNFNGSAATFKDGTFSSFLIGGNILSQSDYYTNLTTLLTALGVSL